MLALFLNQTTAAGILIAHPFNDVGRERQLALYSLRSKGRNDDGFTVQSIRCQKERKLATTETRVLHLASYRSGNERAANVAKRAGVVKRGLRPNESPDDIAEVWTAWGIQANFMHKPVLKLGCSRARLKHYYIPINYSIPLVAARCRRLAAGQLYIRVVAIG